MTIRNYILAVLGLALLPNFAALPARAPEAPPAAFAPGETLTYDVTWSIFPAGKLTATLLDDSKDPGKNYEVKTTAISQGFVSLLFNVNDEFHSFFDPNTLCSHRIRKSVNEGRRHRRTEISFDYNRKVAILDERDPTSSTGPSRHSEYSIPGCVEDVVTAFYFVRRQPLEVGKTIRLAINDGGKTADVAVEVQARETLQTGIGSRPALRVEPRVFNELYNRKGRMQVWFSDDAERLPLRIRVMIGVGAITGTLESVTHGGPTGSPAAR